ncbi:Fluconazole resistance protein 1 [Friedmanniomyces endolithicus]|nr:Fluconazole resistance protein 1 [Friedmanniomyces endolithicus]KAK0770750.1 Fluconazole resistance protein 1 [Friedmanniomyces endolithicus]KAK0843844.1 Fluconazole resistance protein 1 [Friedmanniomyces endolithicus]KAK0862815.1 Fluconazole resistance protein 1 [Friedmanniomyces endolithicus]KAK1026697.1 Fluconazole resistance protein 1 [Friedmanniomyces endolithicus]
MFERPESSHTHTPPKKQSLAMSPAPLSPIVKVAFPMRTASQDSADGIRKRVCKACDRCRLKKSKCDGTSPCTRCRADNAICVFGERKKSHDKVYPKGYVEMLEQQQSQLVSGLQETYRRLKAAHAWTGPALTESNGHPLTHDILHALHLLESRVDGSGELETFEEDCQKLQSRLLADGAGYVHRRGSFSSDSDHSQHHNSQSRNAAPAPALSRPGFRDSFDFTSAASSPCPPQSPAPRPHRHTHPTVQTSPLQTSPLSHDPQFYQPDWAISDLSPAETMMQTRYGMQPPQHLLGQQQSLSQLDDIMAHEHMLDFDPSTTGGYDANCGSFPIGSFPAPAFANGFGGGGLPDFMNSPLDPMDLEFSKFIQVTT